MEENVLMMRCTKCGEMNRLPVIYCKKCGAKLDFEKAEKQMIHANRPTWKDRLRTTIRLAVAFGLLLVILLAIWPASLTRTTGDEMAAKRYRMKRELLLDGLNRGMPATQTIEEQEINANLQEIVSAQPPARGGFAAHLEGLGVRFFPGRAAAFVAIGRGPLTLTGTFYAKVKDGQLVVTGAKAGHLPLPGILGKLYADTQAGLFRQLKDESRIVRNLEAVALNTESVELLTKAGD